MGNGALRLSRAIELSTNLTVFIAQATNLGLNIGVDL